MQKRSNRLTTKGVLSKGPGRYHDGGGLYLQVSKNRASNWSLVFQLDGRRREMGLGSAEAVSLSEARQAAAAARALAYGGVDPIAARKPTAHTPTAGGMTFGEFAEERILAMAPSWKPPADGTKSKTHQGWENSIRNWAAPLKDMPLRNITSQDVLAVLEPQWRAKPEIMKSTQERIEKVLSAAVALELRAGPNPAAWKDNLEHLLGSKRKRVRSHRALGYADAPAFCARLRCERHGMGSLALDLTILTAVRSAQSMLAQWREFDLDAGVWRIPMARVKTDDKFEKIRVAHFEVPLSPDAVRVLRQAQMMQFGGRKAVPSAWVFPGFKAGKAISNATMQAVMKRMGFSETPHGFRSTFRTWAENDLVNTPHGEMRRFSFEACEFCLGHLVGGAASLAYRRGQMIPERRLIMNAWADYLASARSAAADIAA